MTNGHIDLHIHSIYSDGTDTPREVLEIAERKGLQVVSITDHDTVSGINEFLDAASDFKVIALPGIEFSVNDYNGLKDIDLLGYFPDIQKFKDSFEAIDNLCTRIKNARLDRLKKIVAILNKNGIKIGCEQIFEAHSDQNKTFGRKHIADMAYQNNPQKFSCVQDVFDQYLGNGCCADVPIDMQLTLKTASAFIHSWGGVSVLAHPGISNGRIPDAQRGHALIDAAVEFGDVDGIEGYYLYHKNRPYVGHYKISKEENQKLCTEYIAHIKRLGKIYTAGSDSHGKNKNIEIGENCGGFPLYEKLLGAFKERFSS
ncbi:MAG: PHP domain-containing protein [bacterium]